LCVLAAGVIENAHREIYSEFAQKASAPAVAAFVARTLGQVQNPNATKFLETARAFSILWGDQLEAFLDEDGGRRREAINSIMANRHQIAHGRPSGITVVRVKDYLSHCIQVFEFIESQLLR
jgi:hypothetical protein